MHPSLSECLAGQVREGEGVCVYLVPDLQPR